MSDLSLGERMPDTEDARLIRQKVRLSLRLSR